jgi:hypothetical protein
MPEEKPEILAVHKQKLEQFLRGLELWEPLIRGKVKCTVCGETVTLNNIGAVVPAGKEVVLCCLKQSCLMKATGRPSVEDEPEEIESKEGEWQDAK